MMKILLMGWAAVVFSMPAMAALPSGAGAGYFGSAWYDSNQGSVVGPYLTYAQCNQALQAAMDNAVNNFGWTVVSVQGCSYNPPAPIAPGGLSALESLQYFSTLLDEITMARQQRLSQDDHDTSMCVIRNIRRACD